MKLLNKFYAAMAATVTVVAVTVGVVNKTLTPPQQVTSDLSYLEPQSFNDSTGMTQPAITLKNTKLGTRQFESQV
ncbi:hypothetical protein [Acinetobacter schindleri]|uniref:hypothetical protein n=1 Tax=Acinetobacter schindleri TaxID=108981 RepID=UPI003F572C20